MLGLERPGLTGLVDRIERRGLLHREVARQDRRAVVVTFTPHGKEITEAFYDEVTARLPEVVAHLSAGDRRQSVETALSIIAAEHVPAIFGGSVATTAS